MGIQETIVALIVLSAAIACIVRFHKFVTGRSTGCDCCSQSKKSQCGGCCCGLQNKKNS